MARTPRFKVAKVEEALRTSGGIYTVAAQKLRCAPNTVKNYVERHPRLQQVREELLDQNLDLAEAHLLSLIADKNLGAITFFLRTQGRSRGYGDKMEVRGKLEVGSVDLGEASLEEIRSWAAWDDDEPGSPGEQ